MTHGFATFDWIMYMVIRQFQYIIGPYSPENLTNWEEVLQLFFPHVVYHTYDDEPAPM